MPSEFTEVIKLTGDASNFESVIDRLFTNLKSLTNGFGVDAKAALKELDSSKIIDGYKKFWIENHAAIERLRAETKKVKDELSKPIVVEARFVRKSTGATVREIQTPSGPRYMDGGKFIKGSDVDFRKSEVIHTDSSRRAKEEFLKNKRDEMSAALRAAEARTKAAALAKEAEIKAYNKVRDARNKAADEVLAHTRRINALVFKDMQNTADKLQSVNILPPTAPRIRGRGVLTQHAFGSLNKNALNVDPALIAQAEGTLRAFHRKRVSMAAAASAQIQADTARHWNNMARLSRIGAGGLAALGQFRGAGALYAGGNVANMLAANGGLSASISAVGATAIVATGAIAAFAGAVAAPIVLGFNALAFNKQLADMSTLLGDATLSAHALRVQMNETMSDIIGNSAKFNRSLGDTVEGFKTALSSGIEEKDLAQFGDIAGILASATGAGFSDATNILTTFKDSYGLAVGEMTKVNDLLVSAVDRGKFSINQLITGLGRVIPIAANTGVSMKELMGTLAGVSRGLRTETAIIGMAGAIQDIVNPTDKAAEVMRKYGVEFGATALKAKGLQGVLDDILDKTGRSPDILGKIFSDDRSQRVVTQYANTTELIKKETQTVSDATGNAIEASNRALNTFGSNIESMWNAISGTLQGVGVDILNVFNEIFFSGERISVDTLTSVRIMVERLGQGVSTLAVIVGTTAKIIYEIMAGIVNVIVAAVDTITSSLAAGLAAVSLDFAKAEALMEGISDRWVAVGNNVKEAFNAAANAPKVLVDAISASEARIALLSKSISTSIDFIYDSADATAKSLVDLTGIIEGLEVDKSSADFFKLTDDELAKRFEKARAALQGIKDEQVAIAARAARQAQFDNAIGASFGQVSSLGAVSNVASASGLGKIDTSEAQNFLNSKEGVFSLVATEVEQSVLKALLPQMRELYITLSPSELSKAILDRVKATYADTVKSKGLTERNVTVVDDPKLKAGTAILNTEEELNSKIEALKALHAVMKGDGADKSEARLAELLSSMRELKNVAAETADEIRALEDEGIKVSKRISTAETFQSAAPGLSKEIIAKSEKDMERLVEKAETLKRKAVEDGRRYDRQIQEATEEATRNEMQRMDKLADQYEKLAQKRIDAEQKANSEIQKLRDKHTDFMSKLNDRSREAKLEGMTDRKKMETLLAEVQLAKQLAVEAAKRGDFAEAAKQSDRAISRYDEAKAAGGDAFKDKFRENRAFGFDSFLGKDLQEIANSGLANNITNVRNQAQEVDSSLIKQQNELASDSMISKLKEALESQPTKVQMDIGDVKIDITSGVDFGGLKEEMRKIAEQTAKKVVLSVQAGVNQSGDTSKNTPTPTGAEPQSSAYPGTRPTVGTSY